MDLEPRVKADMAYIGCKCETKIALAYQLYIFLIEVKLMYNVQYTYNKALNILYITAKPSKKDRENIYIPIRTSEELTMEDIWKLQEILCSEETGPCLNLAFIESDTTIVMYNFYNDFVDLKDPETVFRRRTRDERRSLINSELFKNAESIFEDCFMADITSDNDEEKK